jgi:pimeloyl-ACP methyl ester carboxylesterase
VTQRSLACKISPLAQGFPMGYLPQMSTPREHAELNLLFEGPEDEINVFIHGYSAITKPEEFERLSYQILSARPAGKVYLLYWKSGNWRRPFAAPLLTAGLRVFRISKMFHPAALAVDLAATLGVQGYEFKRNEKRSEELGRSLPGILAGIPKAEGVKLNLIGHSLGGRAIQYALEHHDWRDLVVEDIILMASAGDRDGYEWIQQVSKLNGRLYNAYSKNDYILKISPDLRSRAGRHPIPIEHPKIVNHDFSPFKHTDYWPNLARILDTIWEHYTPSDVIVVE